MRGKLKNRFFPVNLLLVSAWVIMFTVNSCYYNKAELLYPPTNCDTASVTYRGTIVPVLSASCTGCHSGSTPAYNIDLSVYSVVKQHVDNGKLWGAVTHAPGYPAMPANSNKLSDCSLGKIRNWILAGAPNN